MYVDYAQECPIQITPSLPVWLTILSHLCPFTCVTKKIGVGTL